MVASSLPGDSSPMPAALIAPGVFLADHASAMRERVSSGLDVPLEGASACGSCGPCAVPAPTPGSTSPFASSTTAAACCERYLAERAACLLDKSSDPGRLAQAS